MRLVVLMSAVLVLSACATTDPYTGEKKDSNTAKGAAIGAVAGAILGAATSSDKDRDRGIIPGAVAGAAIGGGFGNYMDRQEAELRRELEGTGVRVERNGNEINLIMPGNITFPTNQHAIRTDFYEVLGSVGKVLAEFDKTAIKISGHTDSTGSSDYNQDLSEKRALSVKSYLARKGVARGRLHASGYGERYPVASNKTADGRQENRRVELKLEPIE